MTTHLSPSQWGLVYLIAVVGFLLIDGAWLMVVMKPLFTDMLGAALRPRIAIAPAAIFYLFYVGGILFFTVAPVLEQGSWPSAALRGVLLGLIAYGTYDMTNLATLKSYQLSIALFDTAWGGAVTAITATIGYFAARWLS
ncbi:MAG: DUF2177 family protein [Pseudomonadota bacterium]